MYLLAMLPYKLDEIFYLYIYNVTKMMASTDPRFERDQQAFKQYFPDWHGFEFGQYATTSVCGIDYYTSNVLLSICTECVLESFSDAVHRFQWSEDEVGECVVLLKECIKQYDEQEDKERLGLIYASTSD
jgi:hypothetical protein